MRETTLIRAAHNGHLPVVEHLLQSGADIAARDLVRSSGTLGASGSATWQRLPCSAYLCCAALVSAAPMLALAAAAHPCCAVQQLFVCQSMTPHSTTGLYHNRHQLKDPVLYSDVAADYVLYFPAAVSLCAVLCNRATTLRCTGQLCGAMSKWCGPCWLAVLTEV